MCVPRRIKIEYDDYSVVISYEPDRTYVTYNVYDSLNEYDIEELARLKRLVSDDKKLLQMLFDRFFLCEK